MLILLLGEIYIMRKYSEYTDDDVIKYAKEVKSIASLLRKLNLKVAGGNYANIKRKLQQLDVDCSHWTGQAWNKDSQLKDWSKYTNISSLKRNLIRKRGHKCENCHLEEWQKQDIPLELDHVDGDRTNNLENNLKLLCCNCHALTPTWRGRACKIEETIRFCSNCDKKISKSSKSGLCSPCFNKKNINRKSNKKQYPKTVCPVCKEKFINKKDTICCSDKCSKIKLRKVKDRPSKEQLLKELKESNYCALGRKYGVSDNAIRKWLK